MAEVSIFLQLDGIPGDSTDARHANEIAVLAFSWGLASAGGSPAAGHRGGDRQGDVRRPDRHGAVESGVAPPDAGLRSGAPDQSGVLTMQRAGEKPVDLMVVRLSDVLVGAYSVSAGGGEGGDDEVTLTFGRIQYDVSDGQQLTTASWDLRKGAP